MRRTDDHPTRHPPPAFRLLFQVAVCGLIVAAVMLACDGVDVFGPLRSPLRRASIGLLGTMLAAYPCSSRRP